MLCPSSSPDPVSHGRAPLPPPHCCTCLHLCRSKRIQRFFFSLSLSRRDVFGCFCSPHSFMFLTLVPRSFLGITQIWVHIAGPPPPRTRYAPFFPIARRLQHFLPSSTRIGLRPPTPLHDLNSWSLFCFVASKHKNHKVGESRTRGPTLVLIVFEGNQY